jgi:type VI secretion system protein ImpJ
MNMPLPIDALPDLVQWSEGMLLSPQHLQQNDLYWQEQLRWRFAQAVPHSWGLAALEFDVNKLQECKLRVTRLECLLPDGTPVVFPGRTQALEIDFTQALAGPAKSVRLSVVLPAGSSASTGRDGSARRYDAVQGEMTLDENLGVGLVAVDRLVPRVALWAGSDVPAKYVACPLLEVSRNANSRAVEVGSYHPPMLRWQAADALGRLSLRRRLQIVGDALWSKLRELAGHRADDGPDDGSSVSRTALEAARRLATVLPHFTLLASRPEARPAEVYDSLAQVVGAMAGFGLNPIPPVLDAYQHDNCEPQFRRALDYVVRKLSYIVTNYEFLEFERQGDRFSRRLPNDAGGEIVVELRLPEGRAVAQSDRDALELWLRDACIASQDLLADARRSRVSARPRPMGAEEIARRNLRAGGALFAIDNESFELDGKGRVPLLQPGQPLVIDGYAGGRGLAPDAILLYSPKRAGGRSHA